MENSRLQLAARATHFSVTVAVGVLTDTHSSCGRSSSRGDDRDVNERIGSPSALARRMRTDDTLILSPND